MATLTIRDVPPKVVRALKARAKSNNRSIEEELLGIIEAHVMDRAAAIAEIKRLRAPQKRGATAEEVDAWIREGRQ